MGILKDYGLIDVISKQALCPLQSVEVEAKINDSTSEVAVTQKFLNPSDKAVEAVYKFPLPHDAKVTGFTATFGEATVNALFMESNKAVIEYEKAKKDGDSAVIVESLRDDIFEISVGNIAAGENVTVKISYLQDVKRTDDEIRWLLPTVIAPRYIPADQKAVKDPESLHLVHGVADYRLKFLATWSSAYGLLDISSPSHTIKSQQTDGVWQVEFQGAEPSLDSDVVLVAKLKETSGNAVTFVESKSRYLANVQFRFDATQNQATRPANYVFLIDNSGSMSGEKFEQAKTALQLALRNLEQEDTFNIISFESDFEVYSKVPATYSQKTLEKASNWVEHLDTRGGTEIFEPLNHVFNSYAGTAERELIIMLFTDGEVGNEEQVIRLIRDNNKYLRFFSFGIDTAVNKLFIDGIAEAGNGLPEYVYPGERIEDKVIRQFSRINAEYVEQIKIIGTASHKLKVLPELPKRIFAEENYTFFIETESREVLSQLKVTGLHSGTVDWSLSLPEAVSGEHRLLELQWAKEQIKQFEDEMLDEDISSRHEKALRAQIIEISSEYGIASKYTAMVAVYERDEKVAGKAKRVIVPLAMPNKWEMEIDYSVRSSRNGGFGSTGILQAFSAPMMLNETSFSHNFTGFEMSSRYSSIDKPMINDIISNQDFDDDIPTNADILRAKAVKQNADGSFDSGAGAFAKTSWFVIACLRFPESDWSLYRKQLQKAGEWLISNYAKAPQKSKLLVICATQQLLHHKILKSADQIDFFVREAGQLQPDELKILEDFKNLNFDSLFQAMGVYFDNSELPERLMLSQV